MSKEISYGDLVYGFEGPTSSINFGKYGGPIYISGHMIKWWKNITTSRGRAKILFKKW